MLCEIDRWLVGTTNKCEPRWPHLSFSYCYHLRFEMINRSFLRILFGIVFLFVYYTFFGKSFIGRCKNNFHWLLVMEKMKKREN